MTLDEFASTAMSGLCSVCSQRTGVVGKPPECWNCRRDRVEASDTIPAPPPVACDEFILPCGCLMPGGNVCNDAFGHAGECSYISGEVAERNCPACGGSGSEALPRAPGGWYSEPDYATCGVCGGSGVGR